MANHPTADDVYRMVHEDYPSISRATVYRVLNKLAENGAVFKVNISNGADHFDHQTFKHYHAHCRVCGGVCDVNLNPIQLLEEGAVETDGDFTISGYSLQFDGVCGKCKEKAGA